MEMILMAILIVMECLNGPCGEAINPIDPPPPIEEMCLSLTSYWVWDETGNRLDGWEGQCDEDCSWTGAGYYLPETSEEYSGGYAACVYDWTKLKGSSTRVVSYGDTSLFCVDNFGDINYWEPYYHDLYERWVIPIDVLAPFEHGLVCNWSLSWGNPGSFN